MKKISILLTGILGLSLSAQIQEIPVPKPAGAPDTENMNLYEIVDAMDAYWENTPHDFKGSGFKVYQRWKELRLSEVKSNGQVFMPQDFKDFNQVNRNVNTNLVTWEPLGPFNHNNRGSWSPGQGRVNITVEDPNNNNTYYIGAPDGGIWKTSDNGDSWTSLSDFLPTIGVSGIAVDYNNSNIIYIATGDEDGLDSLTSGVYKSIDGGVTWNYSGLDNAVLLGEIHINPDDSNELYVCGRNALYKSTNAGNSWVAITNSRAKEFRFKPGDPSTFYIVERSGNTTWSVRKSTDGGANFTNVYSNVNSGRIVIDVTPANPEVLYFLAVDSNNSYNGVWKSNDSGTTINQVHNSTEGNILESTQAWYDLAIAVSDADENRIFTGCLNIWTSTNGGDDFVKLNNWVVNQSGTNYTHADIHALKYYDGKFFASTDGGVYVSEDNGVNFSDKTINGLNISQFYRVDVANDANGNIVGGLQDNGGFAFDNNTWVSYHGADGMDAAIDPTNSNIGYGFLQFGGALSKYDFNLNQRTAYISSPNNGSGSIQGSWITPLSIGNSGAIYAGYNQVYKLNQTTNAWEAYGNLLGGNATQIRVNPTNDDEILVALNNSLKRVTNTNFGITTTDIAVPNPGGNFRNIAYNETVSNTFYVIKQSKVYKTIDGGVNFTDITYNVSGTGNFNSIVHQSTSVNNTLYLITNRGVYYTNDDLTEWISISDGLPNVNFTDIDVNTVENHLVLSTYGRGIWRAALPQENLSTIDFNTGKDQLVYPNPTKGSVSLKAEINEPTEVTVKSLTGKLVYKNNFSNISTNDAIDLSKLNNGVYIITYKSARRLITKKLMIQK